MNAHTNIRNSKVALFNCLLCKQFMIHLHVFTLKLSNKSKIMLTGIKTLMMSINNISILMLLICKQLCLSAFFGFHD